MVKVRGIYKLGDVGEAGRISRNRWVRLTGDAGVFDESLFTGIAEMMHGLCFV